MAGHHSQCLERVAFTVAESVFLVQEARKISVTPLVCLIEQFSNYSQFSQLSIMKCYSEVVSESALHRSTCCFITIKD